MGGVIAKMEHVKILVIEIDREERERELQRRFLFWEK